MTPELFTAWAESVFGKYLPAMKMEVEKWLEPHSPSFVAGMRLTALEGHPSTYGRPPGIYELEQFKIKAYERGHTIDAIEASKRNTKLISDKDYDEESVLPREEQARLWAELRKRVEYEREKAGIIKKSPVA